MAYSKNGFSNLISGNVRDCTFYLMNGQHIARRKAKMISNPRTGSQQLNRQNISILLNFFRQLKPLLYLSLNDRPINRTAYNHFFSLNLNSSVINGEFNPRKLVLSTCSFQAAGFRVTRQSSHQDQFLLTWDNDCDELKQASDKLLVAYIDIGSGRFQYSVTSAIRSSQEATVIFNLDPDASTVYLNLFFVRQDYSKSSMLEIFEFS